MKHLFLALTFLASTLTVQAQQKETLKDSASYAIGMLIAGNIQQMGISDINTEKLSKAVQDALANKTAFPIEKAQDVFQRYLKIESEKKFASVKAEGSKFLEDNKKKPTVQVTASGLQYEVMKMGTGARPAATDKVTTHYHGTLINGNIFDSSVQRGEPIEFDVNGVIPGWTEALQLMPCGSKFRLYVPYNLAYGERGAGKDIGPFSTLIFDVELLKINGKDETGK